MPAYRLRYRNLSGPDPMTPITAQLDAASEQAAIAALKAQHSGQDLRIERVTSDIPAPRKRRSRNEWIILALVLTIGAVHLANSWLR